MKEPHAAQKPFDGAIQPFWRRQRERPIGGEEQHIPSGMWRVKQTSSEAEWGGGGCRKDVFQGVFISPPLHVELWIALVAFIRLWPSTSWLPHVRLSEAGKAHKMCSVDVKTCDGPRIVVLELCKPSTASRGLNCCCRVLVGILPSTRGGFQMTPWSQKF